MAIGDAGDSAFAEKFAVMRQVLNERQWRLYLGAEANALGRGGIAAVARAAGVSQNTVAAGSAQARDPEALAALEPVRSRRAGAGRPSAENRQPGLTRALKGLLEEGKRGDPMSEITWSILSLRDIARRLALAGFTCGKDTVARLMRADGWSLQGMSRVMEGNQHEDRDDQFGHINSRIEEYRAAGDPAVSVDGKKKEYLGAYYREGTSWRPAGEPVRVRDHDFKDKDTPRIVPYGIYDIAANRGFVLVGTSGDTAAFAVNAIRLWWQEEGQFRYPGARRLLLTCDAGGSNACQSRLWKDQLAVLAEETGLVIEVCHFPPGTSKWNKIEHRLFCHITRTWRARPLMTAGDAVAGIAATITSQGLKCHPVRDDGHYPGGIKVSDERMGYLQDRVLDRNAFRGEWNYAVLPVPRPAPEPEPEPERPGRVPAAVLNHPALTGVAAEDLDTAAAALDIAFEARLQQRNYILRGGPRVNNVRSTRVNARRALGITDHLLALRLRDHLSLPVAAIGALLGVDASTVTHATTLARELLAAARTELPATPPPGAIPRTPGELISYAAAAGILLAIPENRHAMPERFITRKSRPRRATPENLN
ncbi:MAG TPA: ISAzo13 family transposase [Trebonia sp.]